MLTRIKYNLVLSHALLLLVCVTTIAPFYWMISTALKTPEAIVQFPPSLLPDPVVLSNIPKVFELMPMGMAFFNSAKITILVTVGTLFTSSLAAYAFSKIHFKWGAGIFGLFVATLMIPNQVTLIPLYLLFSKMNWVDTHLPLIVPAVLMNPYGVFLLRQFMRGIPNDYVEAAKIDGCNHFRVYWQIVLPLCKPAAITLALFTFIGNWNNFIGPLIFLSSEEKYTVPLIIATFRGVYTVDWGLLMSASTVAVIPIVILYLFTQKYYIEGLNMSGGIKG